MADGRFAQVNREGRAVTIFDMTGTDADPQRVEELARGIVAAVGEGDGAGADVLYRIAQWGSVAEALTVTRPWDAPEVERGRGRKPLAGYWKAQSYLDPQTGAIVPIPNSPLREAVSDRVTELLREDDDE